MDLFKKNGLKYTRLDDDVSFQILRTNPKLTTNTKLIYDGEDLYMESYDAEPLLSTIKYKNYKVWRTGLFNRDIRNFLLGTDMSAYSIGQSVRDTIVLDNFDNQFETMYWCGVESINSDAYPQEMGCIAPLYLRKKRPNYFVIFRIDTPANTNLSDKIEYKDWIYDFNSDIRKRAKIIKTFDLREGTPIGDYIKRYVEQKNFKYDQSIYVNFSSNEIYYYGIDKSSGVLSQRVENFEEQLLNNDNTIMKVDDWITSGFERNNLIFPYIINFEFLFDDKEASEFKFGRYFGVYCNDIDLYDLDVEDSHKSKDDMGTTTTLITNWGEDDKVEMNENYFYYIKDKYNNIHSLLKPQVPGYFPIAGSVNINDFTGFEPTSVSTFAERVNGLGHSMMILEIKESFNGQQIRMYNTTDSENENIITAFTASSQLGYREFYDNSFSNKGTLDDIAFALAGAIRTCNSDEFKWITAFSSGNRVIIKAMYPGSSLNGVFDISFDSVTTELKSIIKLTNSFDGGTDIDGCLFKIYTSDVEMFIDDSGSDRDSTRYFRCGIGRNNSAIKAIIPYVNENREIDENYLLVITDKYGPYVKISKTENVEIIDRFYAKMGVLSFFPVRDFDFDTMSSAYGESSMIENELRERGLAEDEGSSEEGEIKYGRFFYYNGDKLKSEYEYYFENIIPELSTVSKTVPYISKWGYIDESKDSCENPYRLNTSKIFEACNMSANTFMKKGDIMEYTHSMPYYINNKYTSPSSDENAPKNEYQYINNVDSGLWDSCSSYTDALNAWTNYFADKTVNHFDEMFGDTSATTSFGNKRFNKKYSRFLKGDSVQKSSTLFRGVKFEVTELKNGKEIRSGKYNDYKFSFIYVPISDSDNVKQTVHFIKNDTFKYIVGIVFFDVKTDFKELNFNKAYVYAGCMGFIDLEKNENNQD